MCQTPRPFREWKRWGPFPRTPGCSRPARAAPQHGIGRGNRSSLKLSPSTRLCPSSTRRFCVILSRNIFTTFFLLLCSRMVCGFPHREPSCLKVPLSTSRPTYTPPASIQAYTSSTLFRLMMFGTEGNGICGLAEGFVVSVSVT